VLSFIFFIDADDQGNQGNNEHPENHHQLQRINDTQKAYSL